MRIIKILFLFCLLFTNCKQNTATNASRFENIENPEKYLTDLSKSVVIKSVEKRDVNGDNLLDQEILILTGGGNYMSFYFLNNGNQSYNMSNMDEFFGYEDNEEDSQNLDKPEDFFNNLDEANHEILTHLKSDINNDGFTDAIIVTHYTEKEENTYESYDAALFYGNKNNTYTHINSIELSVLNNNQDYIFDKLVSKNNYYSFELKNKLKKKIITFTFNDDSQDFMLHKYGIINFDVLGNILNEQVKDKNDFNQVSFANYTADLLSFSKEVNVTNTKELISLLGSNKTIYLAKGTYYLNQIDNYPAEASKALNKIDFSDYQHREFYKNEFYNLTGSNPEEEPFGTYFELSFNNLENVKFIGQGEVKLVVTNEFLSVLSFNDCSNISLENLYLVHEVGGICSANVIDLFNCNSFNFKNTTLDGSGEIGLDAYKSNQINFKNSNITNCSDGAMSLYESNVTFKGGTISKNKVYSALISISENSRLELNRTEIRNNIKNEINDNEALIFEAIKSEIILNNTCVIKENINLKVANEESNIDFKSTILR